MVEEKAFQSERRRELTQLRETGDRSLNPNLRDLRSIVLRLTD